MKLDLSHNPSYTWKSLWASKGVLSLGSYWKVGTGNSLLILDDAWLPSSPNFKIVSNVPILQNVTVSELIDPISKV